MCLISIIVPVYNSEKYLRDCLDSILRQSLKDFELICVDDGSKDNSPQILLDYSDKDSRIRVVLNSHVEGCGAGRARNTGLYQAKGQYLIFLDSDDYFHPDLLLLLYKKITANDCDIALCEAFQVDEKTGKKSFLASRVSNDNIFRKRFFSASEINECLFQSIASTVWNCMFRAAFIKANHLMFQETPWSDDAVFVYMALIQASRISYIQERLIYYRVNTGVSQTDKRFTNSSIIYKSSLKLKSSLIDLGVYNIYRESYVLRTIRLIQSYLRDCDNWETYKESYNSIKYDYHDYLDIEAIKDFDAEEYRFEIQFHADIMNYSAEEYFFNKHKNKYAVEDAIIPKDLFGKRVVIFGAGVYGKRVVAHVMKNNLFDIVAWVDNKKNQSRMITNGNIVNELDFDYILISIKRKQMVKEVIAEVLRQGIPDSKIRHI